MAIKIGGTTIINDSRDGVNFNSIGVGTTNPKSTLDVNGNLNVSGISTFSQQIVLENNIRVGNNTTGNSITSGTKNIFIGDNAGAQITGGSNNIILGNLDNDVIGANDNNSLVVGYGKTSIISGIITTQTLTNIESGFIFDPVSAILQDELLGNTLTFPQDQVSIGQTVFNVSEGDLQQLLNVIAELELPDLDSGLYFVAHDPTVATGFGGNETLGIFPNNRSRIVAFTGPIGADTITVEDGSLINRDVGDFPYFRNNYRWSIKYVSPLSVVNELVAGTKQVRAVGIGTNNPRFPLDIRNPYATGDESNVPMLFVEGSAVVAGKYLKIGNSSMVLESDGSGNERIKMGSVLLGVSSETSASNTLTATGSISAKSFVESSSVGNSTTTDYHVEYNVIVGYKTTGDLNLGVGSTEIYIVDGNRSPYLHTVQGKIYRFNQEDISNSGNLIKFYIDENGSTEYTTGVTTSGVLAGSTGSFVTLNVTESTPSTLYYDSANGTKVGNIILRSGRQGTSISVLDNTSSNSTYYPTYVDTSSGISTELIVSSTKLNFNPSTGNFSATQFTSLSDENQKTNIRIIDNAMEIVKQLNGVRYDWIDNNKPSIGLIAQDVERVLPEIVETSSDNVKSVSYGNLVGVLIEAIKDLQDQIKELKRK